MWNFIDKQFYLYSFLDSKFLNIKSLHCYQIFNQSRYFYLVHSIWFLNFQNKIYTICYSFSTWYTWNHLIVGTWKTSSKF
jgi:hypothetical protein